MNKKSNPYFYWWAAAITLTITSISIILYTYKINHGGEISWEGSSSLIQAIFGIILIFSTVSTFIRADMQVNKAQEQIDLTQRIEFRHSLTIDIIDQKLIFFNVSKYPIIIKSLSIELSGSSQENDLLRGQIINPGEKAAIGLGMINKNIKAVLSREIRERENSSFPDHNTQQDLDETTQFLLKFEYNYGGSGSIIYHKSYKLYFKDTVDRKNLSINPKTAHFQIDDFYYKIPARNKRKEKKVTVYQEWDIPLPSIQK